MRYRFNGFEVDSGRFELCRGGARVRIEPKALELLIFLLERHPEAVSKDALLDALWPDTTVTEGSLTRAVGEVRRALREPARKGGAIRTIRGRGYAIGAEVERIEARREPPGGPRLADRYALGEPVGHGASKIAYRALDTRLDREVAVAVVQTSDLDEIERERIEREVRATARLGEHPNIITVFDVVRESERICIVTELMTGGDATQALAASENARLPIDVALRAARDVARALAHAHSRGVIHRDVKPANIYLSDDGSARLADFGLALSGAAPASLLENRGHIVGTLAYLPPEQIRGEVPVPQSDLYALGATLYHLLTGEPPFPGADAASVAARHLGGRPPSLSERVPAVPEALDSLVAALLAKRIEERPPSAAALAAALEDIRSALAQGTAPPVPKFVRARRVKRPPIVAREQEVARLRDALEAALAGDRRIVAIEGEAGMGKSRLVDELADLASLRGARVLAGTCQEGGEQVAYWPWRQVLRTLAEGQTEADLESDLGLGASEVVALLPELRQLLGPVEPTVEHGDESRLRLFDTVARWLTAAAARQPLLFVLDDLHWADLASLDLLRFLARSVRDARWMIVCTYRPVEIGRDLARRQRLIEGSIPVFDEQLILLGLQVDAIRELFVQLATLIPSPSQAEALRRTTEGNPFLLKEALRLIQAEGGVDGGQLTFVPSELPTRRRFVEWRLARLSPPCREALSLAAVIGRAFDAAVLARVAGCERGDLDEALLVAAGEGLIEGTGSPGGWRFHHILTRDALYAALDDARRRDLHARVGTALEEMAGSGLDEVTELARHFAEALPDGDPAKALDYAERAARAAMEVGGFEEALSLYEQAARSASLADVDPFRRMELEMEMGSCAIRAGHVDRAEEVFLRAAAWARQAGRGDVIARCAIQLTTSGYMYGGADRPATVALLREAAEAADLEDALRARVEMGLSRIYSMMGDIELGETHLRRAESLCAETTAELALARIRFAQTRACRPERKPGFVEEVLDAAAELDRLRKRGNDGGAAPGLETMAVAEVGRIGANMIRGDAAEVERALEACRELAARSGSAFDRWRAANCTAIWQHVTGRLEEAESTALSALAIAHEGGIPSGMFPPGLALQGLRRLRGRPGEILGVIRKQVEAATEVTSTTGRSLMAASYAELGDRESALEQIETVVQDDLVRVRRNHTGLSAAAYLAEALSTLEEPRYAEEIYQLLLTHAGLHVVTGAVVNHQGATDYYLGILAVLWGRYADAERHFLDAERMMEAVGGRPLLARIRAEYAVLCSRRRARGDVERAIELANLALETAEELGLPPIAERALFGKLSAQGVDLADTSQSIHAVASGVGRRSDRLDPPRGPDGTVTLVFSDLVGFTRLMRQLGDAESHQIVRMHNAIVREQLALEGGYEVEIQGDGFLLAFADPLSATRCSMAILRELEACSRRVDVALEARIGIHTGPVIRDADKFFGETVVRAYRISDAASSGEILVSARAAELLAHDPAIPLGPARDAALKGFDGPEPVHAVRWADAPAPAGVS